MQKCADVDHLEHAQSFIRAFSLYLYTVVSDEFVRE